MPVIRARIRAAAARFRSERGAVLVFMALFAPVAILFGGFVMDVGNWFEHARHLQTQADAAALAGGRQFQLPCSAAIDSSILAAASKYSGVSTGSYNPQIGGTNQGSIVENFNKPEYPDPTQPNGYEVNSPVDSTVHATPTPYSGPCEADMLDVKMNEINLPWWFKAANVPYISAHARVELQQESSTNGAAPLAVQTSNPGAAEAFFIDEDTGAQITGLPVVTLCDTGSTFSTGAAAGEEDWVSGTVSGSTCLPSSFSVAVPASTPNIGVIVALAQSSNLLGTTMSGTCSTAGVNCFDQNPGPSLLHIQTYTVSSGTVNSPHVDSVVLQNVAGYAGSPAPCSDQYFSNDVASGPASCTVGVAATLDVGGTPNPAGLTVSAVIGGTSYPLCYQTSGTYSGQWTTDPLGTVGSGCPPIAVPAANAGGTANSYQVDLKTKCSTSTTPGCTSNTAVTLPDVQRSYAADSSTSGSVGYLDLAQNGVGDANSFEACDANDNNSCTYSGLTFGMGIEGLYSSGTGGGQPVTLHIQSNATSSDSGLVNCGQGTGGNADRLAIEFGCAGTYAINGAANDPHGSDPTCIYTGQTNPPADCVAAKHGLTVGPVKQGINYRICGSAPNCNGPTGDTTAAGAATGTVAYCPNKWPAAGVPVSTIPANDSRLITMFVTPYGSLSTSNEYPIVGFAEFYVIGFPGDGCASDPTPPGSNGSNLLITGYFLEYVDPNPVTTGGPLCDNGGFGNCVVVLSQ